MDIAIKPSRADTIRSLKARSPQLSEPELARATGANLSEVRQALARRQVLRLQSRRRG